MLKKDGILLREIRYDDLKQLKDWRNSDYIRPFVREFKPLSMVNQKKWFESLCDSNNIMFAIEDVRNVGLIGCCGLTYINWKDGNAEVSIYIGKKDWQGKGNATKALRLLLEYGFNELRLYRIFATIFEYNEKSIKFFEKNGFKFEGKHRGARFWNGKYYNEHMYSILSNEWKDVSKKVTVSLDNTHFH